MKFRIWTSGLPYFSISRLRHFFIEIKTTIDNQALARKFRRFKVTRHNDFPLKTKPIKPFVPVPRTQVLCPLWGEGM